MINMKRFDLNLLLALDALLAERSVSGAAKRLHLSQPAVSTLLARLRKLFNDPLLLRGYGGMLPTPLARELMGPVSRLLAEIHHLVDNGSVFDPAKAESTFTVSAPDYIQHTLLPPLIRALRKEAPKVKLGIKPFVFGQMQKQMESGEVDLCICPMFQNVPTLHATSLYTERIVFVVRRSHPKARRRLTLEQFCQLDHVVVTPNRIAERTDEALAAAGRARRVAMTLPDYLLVPDVVCASDMIGTLPERLAKRHATRLRVMEPPVKLNDFTLAAFWHERTQHTPLHNWLRGKVIQLLLEE